MPENRFRLYEGLGLGSEDGRPRRALPPFERDARWTSPRYYMADDGLRDAVNVALLLGQPLLLTGEPGTGKTQLAFSITEELDLAGPFVFNTKTTSVSTDLFYAYDALRHFHESKLSGEKSDAREYVTFHALGLAILAAGRPERSNAFLDAASHIPEPRRSLVLIDEIDKAPRDLPNDVLNEIEAMRFRVPELQETFECEPAFRPVVILTSNSEKDLPEPFLRRCVYYHIEFPSAERLQQIVGNRLPPGSPFTPERVAEAIAHFLSVREEARKKKPATAELLGWLQLIESLDLDLSGKKPGHKEMLALSYSALLKDKEDLRGAQSRARKG